MKFKKPPDFHLECGCIFQIQKGVRAQGMELVGVQAFSNKGGNSGISMSAAGRIVNRSGQRKTGVIFFNFCPVCGKQIATRLIGKEENQEGGQ